MHLEVVNCHAAVRREIDGRIQCADGIYRLHIPPKMCGECSRRRPKDSTKGYVLGAMPAAASKPNSAQIASTNRARSAEYLIQRGRSLWASLHARAWPAYTPRQNNAWLASFTAMVPCGQCRKSWLALMAAHPPPLQQPEAMERWAIDRHNDVNVEMGKAVF